MRKFINFIKRLFGFGSVAVPPIQVDPVEPVTIPPVVGSTESDIVLGKIVNAIGHEDEMIKLAVSYVKRVVYSHYFKDEVIRAKFTSTNGMSNEEIYKKFINNLITVNVCMFYGSFMQNKVYKTQGYEQGDGFVYANRYFIQDAFDMGCLILHECAHALGWHHDSASESTSIPYAMNRIFIKVASKIGIKQ